MRNQNGLAYHIDLFRENVFRLVGAIDNSFYGCKI